MAEWKRALRLGPMQVQVGLAAKSIDEAVAFQPVPPRVSASSPPDAGGVHRLPPGDDASASAGPGAAPRAG